MNQFDEWKKLIDRNEPKNKAEDGVYITAGSVIIGTALNSVVSGGYATVYVNIK